MTFFCKRVFHNLLRHLGVYLVFLLEFALGTAILSGTLSVVLSLRRDLRAEQQKLAEGTIGVVRYTQSAPGLMNSGPFRGRNRATFPTRPTAIWRQCTATS